MKYFIFYVITFKRLFPTYVKVSINGTSEIKKKLRDDKLIFLISQKKWGATPPPPVLRPLCRVLDSCVAPFLQFMFTRSISGYGCNHVVSFDIGYLT